MSDRQIPRMEFLTAQSLIGGLSTPSKMPWYSWSTPARACVTGSKLRELKGSTCEKCYAHKGYYRMGVVKTALDRRLRAIDDPQFVEAFVTTLTYLYYKQPEPREDRFRWHDSGDIQSVDHLDKIVQICRRTPFLRHYLPTREMKFVRTWLADNPGGFPSNLFLKLSHSMVGWSYGNQPFGLDFTTVGRDDDAELHQCPARKQGNKCLSCDACWSAGNVNYPLH